METALERHHSGKVGREGRPGHVGIAADIHGDACLGDAAGTGRPARILVVAAAQVRGPDQGGVDDEGVPALIRSQLEAVSRLTDRPEAPRDLDAPAVDLLIDAGPALAQLAEGGLDQEGSVVGHSQALDPAVGHLNLIRIGAGLDDELLLQIAAVAGDLEVDAVPHVPVDHLRVGTYSRAPGRRVTAREEVVGARQGSTRLERAARAGANEVLGEHEPLPLAAVSPEEIEDRALRCEPESSARGSQVVVGSAVYLPPVLDEGGRCGGGAKPRPLPLRSALIGRSALGDADRMDLDGPGRRRPDSHEGARRPVPREIGARLARKSTHVRTGTY